MNLKYDTFSKANDGKKLLKSQYPEEMNKHKVKLAVLMCSE